jgi:hypothetical protein
MPGVNQSELKALRVLFPGFTDDCLVLLYQQYFIHARNMLDIEPSTFKSVIEYYAQIGRHQNELQEIAATLPSIFTQLAGISNEQLSDLILAVYKNCARIGFRTPHHLVSDKWYYYQAGGSVCMCIVKYLYTIRICVFELAPSQYLSSEFVWSVMRNGDFRDVETFGFKKFSILKFEIQNNEVRVDLSMVNEIHGPRKSINGPHIPRSSSLLVCMKCL